ncbi:aldolase/citrate lyase family protein [Natronococcus sp. A-GB1]|uniref:HpcH/HpaI aldolase family protein n=1 Tax=Natronococcus sp. A-GB1 TaxID=3037648 RepID=UPI0024202EDF|nr:aldolase/citrate lyase family protein [Natronococcus sp. A-GB1]MDG5761660.1 aldolase/citrate lyase family protein [Natronococcus sp. A-GB1]
MSHLKEALETGDYPVGNWLSIGDPAVAEVSAVLGFDFILVDTEHTTMSLETVENISRAIDARDAPTEAIVRVPCNDQARIKRVLDIGIAGVMVPMVESADEAEQLVEAVNYPPEGNRGIASGRATEYGMEFVDYVSEANGSIVTIAQIESKTGLANVEEIAAVDGIDALFVGPADLSGALGVFAEWGAAELQDAIDRVLKAGNQHNTPVGTLTVSQEQIEGRVESGFDFLIVGKDTSYLADGSRSAKERYEKAVAEHTGPVVENE